MAEGAFEARTLAAVLNRALLPLATLKADLPRARDMAWRESRCRKIILTSTRNSNIPLTPLAALLPFSDPPASIRAGLDSFNPILTARL